MDKLYAKEMNALRTTLEKEAPSVAPREDYEPLLFLEPEERGCVLTLMEEQLQALMEVPDLEFMINQKEYSKLQELFKKERLSSLERQVAKLTQHLEEVTNQVTLLEAENEKLQKRLLQEQARRASSSSSSVRSKQERSTSRVPSPGGGPSPGGASPGRVPSPAMLMQRGTSGEGLRIASPVGRPKAGRPKRGAKYSPAGQEAVDDYG